MYLWLTAGAQKLSLGSPDAASWGAQAQVGAALTFKEYELARDGTWSLEGDSGFEQENPERRLQLAGAPSEQDSPGWHKAKAEV